MILNKSIAPSEGEVSVKSYLCTSFNSFLLGIKADGYLEITNKRLLFQALGSGVTKNKSVIHSEVPIAEIIGINIYKGKSVHLLRFLLSIFILIPLIAIVTRAIFAWLLKFLDNSPGIMQVLAWGLFLAIAYYAHMEQRKANDDEELTKGNTKDQSLRILAMMAAAVGILFLISGNYLLPGRFYYEEMKSELVASIVVLLYTLYAAFCYSKKPAFSLFVHSKSSSNSIVKISGPSPMGGMNSVASKALTSRPGRDSLLVLQELGAMILDIQNMGEYGIEKWQKNK